MALLEKAAGQGHAYAMHVLGNIHRTRKEHEQAVEWYTKGAEAGLPRAVFSLGCRLESGEGVAAPDYPAAVDWYTRAADAGHGSAAQNLCAMYSVGRGRAWQIMTLPAVIIQISSPSFLELDGIPRRDEHYIPGPGARRDA